MAGDWIKMRASLLTNPRVTALCKLIENSKTVGKKLSSGYGGALREIVTRDVTRDVTVASLFRVWCAANEHTTDGVWHGIELDDLDHVAGVPGFGGMMEAVGWAVVDVDNQTVTFPNFLEYNAPAKEGRGSSAAERQRRYREKNRADRNESNVTSNVTRDVTRDVTRCATSDVEKRREEKSIEREREGENDELKTENYPGVTLLDSAEFRAAWGRWEQKHIHLKSRMMDFTQRGALLRKLQANTADVDDAIACIEYSLAYCDNLQIDGRHNYKQQHTQPIKAKKRDAVTEALEKMGTAQ